MDQKSLSRRTLLIYREFFWWAPPVIALAAGGAVYLKGLSIIPSLFHASSSEIVRLFCVSVWVLWLASGPLCLLIYSSDELQYDMKRWVRGKWLRLKEGW